MITRTLTRRLEYLESHCEPVWEKHVINFQLVNSDREIVEETPLNGTRRPRKTPASEGHGVGGADTNELNRLRRSGGINAISPPIADANMAAPLFERPMIHPEVASNMPGERVRPAEAFRDGDPGVIIINAARQMEITGHPA